MFKRITATFSSLLSTASPTRASPERPSVDLNQAVENPSLVAAMDRVARENSEPAKDVLLQELQRANFLAAILSPDLKVQADSAGMKEIAKGSMFGVLSAGKDGKNYLVLFTDWRAVQAHTQMEVTGWVLPSKDAWNFALQGATYDGVVINPAHNALPLARPMLEYLAREHQ